MKSDVIVFKERAGKPGGGKGILIGYNTSFTPATQMIDAVCYGTENSSDEDIFHREPSKRQQSEDLL